MPDLNLVQILHPAMNWLPLCPQYSIVELPINKLTNWFTLLYPLTTRITIKLRFACSTEPKQKILWARGLKQSKIKIIPMQAWYEDCAKCANFETQAVFYCNA